MTRSSQQAIADFHHKLAPLRLVIERSPALTATFDPLVTALASFGSAELIRREDERRDVLGLTAIGRPARRGANDHNERGLAALGQARGAVPAFRREIREHADKRADADRIDTLHDDLREALATLDLKASDVRQLDDRIATTLQSVRDHGAEGLANELDEALAELEEVRKRPDRGAADNIPLWKAIGIAALLVFGVYALFKCSWWGECQPLENVGWISAEALGWFIVIFC